VHASPTVLGLPSSHAVPSGFAGFEQAPVAWSRQMPAVWHWSLAAHTTPRQWSVPAHTPAWQASPTVLALPSSHAVPSGFAGFEQAPVAWSQALSWQASPGGQVTPRQ